MVVMKTALIVVVTMGAILLIGIDIMRNKLEGIEAEAQVTDDILVEAREEGRTGAL